MASKTLYEVTMVKKGRKSLMGKEFKSIQAVNKELKPGESITCSWFELNPKATHKYFKKVRIGYREFEADKTGLSYSRFPLYEY